MVSSLSVTQRWDRSKDQPAASRHLAQSTRGLQASISCGCCGSTLTGSTYCQRATAPTSRMAPQSRFTTSGPKWWHRPWPTIRVVGAVAAEPAHH